MLGNIRTLLKRKDAVLHEGRLGLIANQVAFDFTSGRYLHELLHERGVLKTLFLPEHGLFAELQDQEPLIDGSVYGLSGSGGAGGAPEAGEGLNVVSLYGRDEESLRPAPELVRGLDGLVIALQDVGVRYYTFAVTVAYFLEELALSAPSCRVYVLDSPNPAGRRVEGTLLPESYASFVGYPGLPQRHGLTLGELLLYLREARSWPLELEILPPETPTSEMPASGAPVFGAPVFGASSAPYFIWPSPNMPGELTPRLYSGQCLLEGTNLSEGRGTTRPFEIWGAPYLRVFDAAREKPPEQRGGLLRPLRFLPTFHKFAGEVCQGAQIHLLSEEYHSLAHTLKLIRWARENHPEFEFRRGVYEFRSDRPAIEILAGDDVLLEYLRGEASFQRVREALQEGEEAWRARASRYLLYDGSLQRTELDPGEDYC